MAETPPIVPLTNINGLVSAAVTTINSNFEAISAVLDDVLSRTGSPPNQMEVALDMNGNTILNLPSPASPTDPVRLEDVNAMQGGGPITINNTITGTTTVVSISALQSVASPATVITAFLSAPGLTGVFSWSSSNLSTQVTNDTAHAIYIPPVTDTTGASGAWIRQYFGPVNLSWFGLTSGALVAGTTATANGTALLAFATWARHQSSLGFGVDVFAEPGTYPWDMAVSGHFVANIKELHFSGYQTTWQNVTANTSFPYQWPDDWAGFLSTLNGLPSGGRYLINSTTIGSQAITAITPSDFANLVIGDYVLLASLDIEYFGYPPNSSNFEYPAVVSTYSNASASPSSVTYSTGTGQLALTFAAAPLGAVTLAATASFTAGVSKITMASVTGLVTGMNVYDTTNSQQIGTIASINGLVIGLVNNASHASSGSTDSLVFTPQINGALVTVSGITVTGGTAPNGTWPILSVSGPGTVVTVQATIGLAATGPASGTLAASGIAVLDRPIRFQHMSTFPDNPSNTDKGGAARVNILKNNGGSGSILYDWNVKHIYEGLTILEATQVTNGQGYITITGKHTEWRYSSFPGISPSLIGFCKIVGCKFTLSPLGSQPDKLIDVCILEANEVLGNLQFGASTNILIATGNTIGGIFAPGAKYNLCNNNSIGTFTPGSSVGITRSCILNGGTVSNFAAADHFGSGVQFVVGSGGITYSSGTFTFPWTNLGVAAVPGMMLHFAQASGLYAGDAGSMMVTGIRGDATNLYVDTTYQSASVPAFSTGQVFARHLQRLIVSGVSGCDEIRRVSAACERGFQELEYLEEQIIGSGTFAGHEKSIGLPVNFDLNVRQACTVSSKTLTITLSLTPIALGSAENLVWVIDLSTTGRRKINQTSGAAVLLGADTLNFNGSSATAFPAGWFLNGNGALTWALSYAPSALTSVQLPWVEMKFQFDPGMYFTVPTAQVDQALLDTLIGMQGALN